MYHRKLTAKYHRCAQFSYCPRIHSASSKFVIRKLNWNINFRMWITDGSKVISGVSSEKKKSELLKTRLFYYKIKKYFPSSCSMISYSRPLSPAQQIFQTSCSFSLLAYRHSRRNVQHDTVQHVPYDWYNTIFTWSRIESFSPVGFIRIVFIVFHVKYWREKERCDASFLSDPMLIDDDNDMNYILQLDTKISSTSV